MKKFYIFLILILFLIGFGYGIYLYSQNSKNTDNSYEAQKVLSSQNVSSNNTEKETTNDFKSETQISNFETKIYTKDQDRQNNISITCSSLNDTIINNGDTFSFCDTVGKATFDKGYKKADVFVKGNVVEALGGGNCQVSTTLYNAVSKLDGIEITERHNHSNSVPYITKGQDAAVSYR